ncbi:LCP family protein [Kitasatospora sp. GP82]|uniref:LCP family protein n=1 Tax=Kitasatospora sp. GP82 TaxID=3035089 RepID=UPI002473CFD4|nr:LCP family protein [Kitasatospora sp. GP82]MDH6124088.1 LCP family protein required for cell wall assembly [Kitasatospora sp. GP82]
MTNVEPISGEPAADHGMPELGGRTAARQAARRGGGGKRGRRWIKITSITLGLTLVAGCGAAYLYYQHLNDNILSGSKNLSDAKGARTAPNAAGQTPLNILLIGTDTRGSAADVALGGSAGDAGRAGLADVQMLLHISADRSNASMISIPRDTLVDIPTCHSEDGKTTYPARKHAMINEALPNGGPGCVVGTWIKLTGLEIDHYMMVDFAGVVSMADAVGGVPVCVNMNLYDRYQPGIGGTGLKLPKGTTYIKGEQALQWLRTRDAWGDDIGRTKAQHLYLSAMVRQLKKNGSLADPGQLMSLAEAATKSIAVDKPIADIKKLYDLGNDLRSVPTERTTSLTVPVDAAKSDPDRLELVQPDTNQIWKMLLADTPIDGKSVKGGGASGGASPDASASPSPSGTVAAAPAREVAKGNVSITVQNASGATARATEIKDALIEAGFTKATAIGGGGSQESTVLTYGSGQSSQAQAIANALNLPSSALKESGSEKTLSLVIGTDWTSGAGYPDSGGTSAGGSAPTKLPKSVESTSADDDKTCMTVNPQGHIYTY